MLQYAPKQLSKQMQQNNINSLNQLHKQKQTKYNQTLKFMTEWANDLLEREHEFTQNQQMLNHQLLEMETKAKSFRSQRTQQSVRDQGGSQVDIVRMIEQQFIKKIEDVYTKQILLYQTTNPVHNQTFTSISSNNEQPSHLQSIQQHSSKSSSSHHRLSSNFSNYFNGYQCHTQSKNNPMHSVDSQPLSKASQLIQQQYNSNSIKEEEGEGDFIDQSEVSMKHYETYEENFMSF